MQLLPPFWSRRIGHPTASRLPLSALLLGYLPAFAIAGRLRVLRTLKTAQARASLPPDQGFSLPFETSFRGRHSWRPYSLRRLRRSALSAVSGVPSQTTGFTWLWLWALLLSVRLSFVRLPSIPNSQFPIPNSSLRSSPRPISIIKLHTLPHFHR